MASKKEYATRFGTFMMAVLFLITALGFSILVIWQAKQQNKKEKEQAAITQAASSQSTDSQDETTKPTEENVLQGTKLKNFTPIAKIDSLQSIDLIAGTGEVVKAGDTVTAHYTGALASDGTIFQSSHDGKNEAIPFSLNGVIKGWANGVPGMKVGGTRRLLIPADQAYGSTPPSGSGIPVNADLVFDIELVKIGE